MANLNRARSIDPSPSSIPAASSAVLFGALFGIGDSLRENECAANIDGIELLAAISRGISTAKLTSRGPLTFESARRASIRELGNQVNTAVGLKIDLPFAQTTTLANLAALNRIVCIEIQNSKAEVICVRTPHNLLLFSGSAQQFQAWAFRAASVLRRLGVSESILENLPVLLETCSEEQCGLAHCTVALMHRYSAAKLAHASLRAIRSGSTLLVTRHSSASCEEIVRIYGRIGRRLLSRRSQTSDFSDILKDLNSALMHILSDETAELLTTFRPSSIEVISEDCDIPIELLGFPKPMGTTSAIVHHISDDRPSINLPGHPSFRFIGAVLASTRQASTELGAVRVIMKATKTQSDSASPQTIIHLAGHSVSPFRLDKILQRLQHDAHADPASSVIVCNSCSSMKSADVLRNFASTVLYTRWPIDDGAAARFATDFYSALNKGLSLAEALASARSSGMHAALWEDPTWLAFTLRSRDGWIHNNDAHLADHCCEIAEIHLTRGDHLTAHTWHRRAATAAYQQNSRSGRLLMLEATGLAFNDLADYHHNLEDFVRSGDFRVQAADAIKRCSKLDHDNPSYQAWALSLRSWGFAEIANYHYFGQRYSVAAYHRSRAATMFLRASELPGVSIDDAKRYKSYGLEYQAWRNLALAASQWHRSRFSDSVHTLDSAVRTMEKAASLHRDKYEASRIRGYSLYLRSVMIRSHAWNALINGEYSAAHCALDEALKVLGRSLNAFVLERDRSWTRGWIHSGVAQQRLVSALASGSSESQPVDVVINHLIAALKSLYEAERSFTLAALQQRTAFASDRLKGILTSVSVCRTLSQRDFTALCRLITDDCLW